MELESGAAVSTVHQPRPLKLSLGNLERERSCSCQNAHSLPVSTQSVEPNPSGTAVWSRFQIDGFYIYFVFLETFSNRPGSHSLTTRRFTRKWQEETPGVTQLVNGAWSSVSQG
jgi:hypothetical protein